MAIGWSYTGYGGIGMDPYGSHTRLIELAFEMAKAGASDDADTLRRFRRIYRHMATSVTSVFAEFGQGPYGPMGGMPGMQIPDTGKLLEQTDRELADL